MKETYDVVALLKEGKTIQLKPQGYSMYPLFVPERDEAILRPVSDEDFKRGQVLLYRGTKGVLTLHRLWKVTSQGYYFVGDNQVEVEGPISKDQIYGTLCGYVRKGKEHNADEVFYTVISRVWLFLRPIRFLISKPIAKLKGNI